MAFAELIANTKFLLDANLPGACPDLTSCNLSLLVAKCIELVSNYAELVDKVLEIFLLYITECQ